MFAVSVVEEDDKLKERVAANALKDVAKLMGPGTYKSGGPTVVIEALKPKVGGSDRAFATLAPVRVLVLVTVPMLVPDWCTTGALGSCLIRDFLPPFFHLYDACPRANALVALPHAYTYTHAPHASFRTVT